MSKEIDEREMIDEAIDEALGIEETEAFELQELRAKTEALEETLSANVWGYSKLGVEAKKAAMHMLSTKTGMYAKIPLYCKGEGCPYAETCMMLKHGIAQQGEPCVVETAEIELRIQGYANDFDIDTASFTDKVMISEIVNLDIMIERCKALMAAEGIPVVDVAVGVDDSGNVIMRPEVSKAIEAYEKFSNKREKLWQLMMATRKDRKQDVQEDYSIHTIIADALKAEEEGTFIEDQRPEGLE